MNRATAAQLPPGTQLLLEGSAQFTGPLAFTQEDAGDPSNPVYVGTYGQGSATIVAPSGSGVIIYDTAGIQVNNLAVTGQASPPQGAGIDLYNDLPDNIKLDHVYLSHLDISGFGNGISVGGGQDTSGFSHVLVSDSALHDNLANGLISFGPAFNAASPNYAHSHITVSHVAAYRNLGDPAQTSHNSGSGIVIGSTNGATIAWSTAYDNGGQGGAVSEGPEGIWAYDSTGVVIKHNLSYRNRSNDSADGGGFDLDQNTSHSVMEYNLSYDNSGPGYLLYTPYSNYADKSNVVRWNISSGDTQINTNYGGIEVWGQIINGAIYNNTVVMPKRSTTASAIPLVLGSGPSGTTIRNNIFLSYQPGPVAYSRSALSRSAALLQGNDYYSAAGTWKILWGGTAYYSLTGFRSATQQEKLSGSATGFATSPRLTGPVLDLTVTTPGGGGSGFMLGSTSPLLHKGLDLLALFGINPGPVDYSGYSVTSSTLNVGAQ
ncbi:MAG TPA: right-handed parallel beta-helix repeat-containing protein [Streptosporangiaceae bacterium]